MFFDSITKPTLIADDTNFRSRSPRSSTDLGERPDPDIASFSGLAGGFLGILGFFEGPLQGGLAELAGLVADGEVEILEAAVEAAVLAGKVKPTSPPTLRAPNPRYPPK